MAAKRKSWREKLQDDKDLPKVITMDGRLSRRWGEGTCVIPAPREVDALMRQAPHGKLVTLDQIRDALARQHGTTIACPLTTGIFVWIAAHAAAEAAEAGEPHPTPYWRTVRTKGELNPKYPHGIEGVRTKLEAEGHRIVQKGRRFFVEKCPEKLVKNLTPKSASINKKRSP